MVPRPANGTHARRSPTRRSTRKRNITTQPSPISKLPPSPSPSPSPLSVNSRSDTEAQPSSPVLRRSERDAYLTLLAVETCESEMMAETLSRASFDLQNIRHLFQPDAWFLKTSLPNSPNSHHHHPAPRYGTATFTPQAQASYAFVNAVAALETAARNLTASSAALANVFHPLPYRPSVTQVLPRTAAQSPARKARTITKKTKTVSDFFDPFNIQPTPPGLCFSLAPSEFGLIQERIRNDLWALVVQTILWNQTTARAGRPVLFKLLSTYPAPEAMVAANLEDVLTIIGRLGLQNKRSALLIDLAKAWLVAPPDPSRRYARKNYPFPGNNWNIADGMLIEGDDPQPGYEIAHLPGVGPYAIDSYRIFYRDTLRGVGAAPHEVFEPEWKRVVPGDKDLRAYLKWKWRQEGWEWDMLTGQRVPIPNSAP